MNQKIIVMALALMVAIPILLGYALAFEDHEHEGWDSGDGEDIESLIAHQSVDYYVQNTSPENNGSLMYNYIITEGGHTYDYNDISQVSWVTTYSAGFPNKNYSSQPVYTYTNDVVTIPISTYNVTAANGILNEDNWPAGLNKSNIRIEGAQLETLSFSSGGDSWSSNVFYGTAVDQDALFNQQTPSDNRYRDFSYPNQIIQSPRYLDLTDFQVSGPANMTYKIYAMELQPFNAGVLYPNLVGDMVFRLERGDVLSYRVYANDEYGAVRPTIYHVSNWNDTPIMLSQVRQSDGSISLISSDTSLAHNGDHIAQIGIARASLSDEIVYLKEFHNYYANVSNGWRLSSNYASPEYEDVEAVWYNGHVNQSVYMAIYMPSNSTVRFYPDTSSSGIVVSRNSSGVTTVGSSELGNYSRIWIEFDCINHEVRFSGVIMPNGSTALPEYGKTPQIANTITVSRPLMDSITTIGLKETNIGRINYRVDLTYTDTGHYWGIYNAWLNPSTYWPDKSLSFKLTSIQEYGDYILFCGKLFNVTDGKIDLNGKATPLRNAVFMSVYSSDEHRWYNTINGQSIDTDDGSSASSIYFHGNWLMKIYKYEMTKTTWTSHEWQPGSFAFNGVDNSFALLGLAGSAAVFIALALYGRHSGAKVGTLLLVCGFAGLIFLCMIV